MSLVERLSQQAPGWHLAYDRGEVIGLAETDAGYTITLQRAYGDLNQVIAFFSIERGEEGERSGILVEYDLTEKIFTQPSDRRTEDYVTGRFG